MLEILKNYGIIRNGKQKCGSSGVLAHPGACAGDHTTYTTAFGRAARFIIRDSFPFYKVENVVVFCARLCALRGSALPCRVGDILHGIFVSRRDQPEGSAALRRCPARTKGRTDMKKRTLSLFLALALSMGLAAPALAEGDITSTSLRIDGAEYPLDAAASGTGWSYDGNYTVTFSGYSDPKGGINVNNPDREVTLSLASGTTSDANFSLMYAYGSRRAHALNVTGSGTLNTAGLNNNTLIVSGGTVNARRS